MIQPDKFSKFIKSKRLALGITQAEMAERVLGDERRRGYICDIENGKKIPRFDTAIAMLNALNCGIDFTE